MPSTPSSAAPDAPRPALFVAAAAIVVVLVAGVVYFFAASDEESTTTLDECPVRLEDRELNVEPGRPAPTFTLPGLNGGCIDLTAFQGQPLVINFWASWCHPCRTEFPLLADARDRYQSEDVEIIGVLSNDHIYSDARRFASERDAQWPLVVDVDEEVGKAYGVRSVPETFFVAADGTLVAHVFGLTTKKDLDEHIEAMLEH